ncbi:histidine kinase [Kutzneria viridogrisea]|uniref:histidine kinase n=1 Tax=Kutzneria viridogrisea TaxID=47990 RepID=A0ABR6BQ00_9PSEU|nr:signal transduction histidine kinase [Kutzneria viridogrisea]
MPLIRPSRFDLVFAPCAYLAGCGFLALDGTIPLTPRVLGAFAVVCLGLLLRTRLPAVGLLLWPLAALLAPATAFSLPMLLVVCEFLYQLVLTSSARWQRPVEVSIYVLTVGVAVLAAVQRPDWRSGLLTALGLVPISLVPMWWALSVRRHREAAEAHRVSAEQAQVIAELDRQAAVTDERNRMARDLHDVIAGHLSAIAIQSEAVLSTGPEDAETTRRVLRSIRENSLASLTEMRAMIGILRSRHAEDPPTAPARLSELARLIDSARATGLRLDTSVDLPPHLPVAVHLVAFRIVQEALTNAAKHAAGAHAAVTITWQEEQLVVEVSNDLTGSPGPVPGGGTGTATMAERAEAVGGWVTCGPDGPVWRVHAVLPLVAVPA